MNATLTASAVFCAAMISGCSTAPMLSVPTGEWEEFSQASATPLRQYTPPRVVAAPTPMPQTVAALPAARQVKEADAPVLKPAVSPPAPAVAKPAAAPIAVLPAPVPAPKIVEVVQRHSGPSPAAQVVADALQPASLAKVQVLPAASVAASPAKVVSTVAPAKIIPVAVVPPVVVAKVAPPPKPTPEQWKLNTSDVTLRRALGKWAAKAGWQLVWDASVDVPINVSATFEGDFRSAVKRLFQSLSAADVNLTGMLYAGNNVLRVTESGRRAQ